MSRESHGPDERCAELFEVLSEYMDGELEPGICAEIETHMQDCAPCVTFLDSLRRTVRLLEADRRPALSEDVRREVIEAIRRLRTPAGDATEGGGKD